MQRGRMAARPHTPDVRYRSAFWEDVPMETLDMHDDPDAPFDKSCDVFGKSCDVFGDGSIIAMLTLGHTQGSVAVLARGDAGYAAFVGDDSYNRRSWEDLKLPGRGRGGDVRDCLHHGGDGLQARLLHTGNGKTMF
jgi:glyoxylase-like metal-dependent hydrolase (beta-lactamase superfamily II)